MDGDSKLHHIVAQPANPAKPPPAALKLDTHNRPSKSKARHPSEDTYDCRSVSPVECNDSFTDEKRWQRPHYVVSSPKQYRHSRDSSNRHAHDLEKLQLGSPRSSNQTLVHLNPIDDHLPSAADAELMKDRRPLKVLLFLSLPCSGLSLLTFAYAIVAILITFVSQPLRLCTSLVCAREQLCHMLIPALNLQLRAIYSVELPKVDEQVSYSALWLLIGHLTAPLLSIGLAIASWTVALYWCLARIVGDPSGIDKRDDGVEAVLGLRRWWERFLLRAVRNQ